MSEPRNEEMLAERLEQYAGGCDNTRLFCPNVFLPECEQRMNEWLASLAATLRESVGALEAAEARAVRCEGERDAANCVQRYGTPFDPTDAKTGTEIQSLRRRVADLEQDRSDLWRCLGIAQDADVDAAIAAIIAARA